MTSFDNRVWTDRFKETGVFQYNNTDSGQVEEIDLKTIDPTRTGISSEFAAFAGLLPSPNNNDTGDGFNTAGHRYLSDNPLDRWEMVLKGDYVVDQKNRLGIAWAHAVEDNPNRLHILGHRNGTHDESNPTGLINLTTSWTPTLLNEARFGSTSRFAENNNSDPRRFETTPLLNFNSLGLPARGGNANRSIFLPQIFPARTWTFNDNFTWIRGDHTFKSGIDIRWNSSFTVAGTDYWLPVATTANSGNRATIPAIAGLSIGDSGRAAQLVNDITGTLGVLRQDFQQVSADGNSFVPFKGKARSWRSREYSFFFQDTWKFSNKLTLLVGTRYEIFPSHYELDGKLSYPLRDGQACVSCIQGISGEGETTLGLLPEGGRELYDTDWNNFAPNVGFTWAPWDDARTTFAANYRISYDRNPLSNTFWASVQQEGQVTSREILGASVSDPRLANAEALSLGIDPGVPFGRKANDRNGRVSVWDSSYITPYVQSWSFRIQRELMRNTVLELAYIGNHAVGQPRATDLNQIEIRKNGFLEGFLAAQSNLATNGDPLVGADTGVFGQIWRAAGNPSSLNDDISRGEAAAVADFVDRTLKGAPLAEAGLPDNFFRLNPQFQRAYFLGNVSHSTFHGFRADVRRRFTEGLQFQANYAIGKGLTDYEGGGSQRNAFRDNDNQGLDKSRSAADARHIVNANFIYELPFGRGRRWGNFSSGLLEALLGGWQVNGIYSYSSGQPVTIQSNGYNNLTLGDAGTVTFNGTDPGIASSVNTSGLKTPNAFTPEQRALFAHPTAGSAGLTAQRFFPDASFWVLDSSVFKSIRTPWLTGEGAELQFRFEFFNATNSTRFEQFRNNFTASSFGNVTSTRDARIMQVALKFIF